jgi:elongation factor G
MDPVFKAILCCKNGDRLDVQLRAAGCRFDGKPAVLVTMSLLGNRVSASAGEAVDRDLLVQDLERAVARGSFFPVLPVCSTTGVGTRELLDMVVAGFPSPLEHPLPEVFTPEGRPGPALACDPDGPLVAEVVKTTSDPYVGRLSLVRVFSGTVRPDSTVHVSGHFTSFFGADTTHEDHDEDERVGALSAPLGKQQRPAALAVAGDLCAIGRLSRAETGDTLSDKDTPLVLRPWSMPEPLLPVAIEAHAKADEDKLSSGLQRLAAEDPTLRVEQNPETHQLVLGAWGRRTPTCARPVGQRYGVQWTRPASSAAPQTLAGKQGPARQAEPVATAQYAICDIEWAAGKAGLRFVDKVVGRSVPRQFIPSVGRGWGE